ncbi:MAG: LUD domain-containing protein [Bacteroidia bacterium]|jgi:L-lactate dehydrogenase complex protein LldF|nr:LUD domain-containing protein [Bacteroidia bacterium]
MRKAEQFISDTEKISTNKEHYSVMQAYGDRYMVSHQTAKKQFQNLNLARERAAYAKWKVTENLDKYLIEFESAIIRKGGKVLWADDAQIALQEIEGLVKKYNAQKIVKGKSMLSDEIGLNAYLRDKGYQVQETDLGEYIIDEAGERPYHMVMPAMHKKTAEIAYLLNEKTTTALDADAEHITADVRQTLRPVFTAADMAITGANFLIADSGLVGITENEGNIRLSLAFAKVHVVVAGIDKLIPSLADIDLFFSLLATYGTGQQLTGYNTVVGPKTSNEIDGPAEFIVLLVDNGRSNLLAQHDQRQALGCIKCGACHQVCPVFHQIGGHAYGVSTNGPIGAVTAQYLSNHDEHKHLSFASPLCGKCTDICPVKIDIHNHLTRNRRDTTQKNLIKNSEKLMWYSWKKFMLSRKNMNKGQTIKSLMIKGFFKSSWGNDRLFPTLAEKSFNQLWRERFGQ